MQRVDGYIVLMRVEGMYFADDWFPKGPMHEKSTGESETWPYYESRDPMVYSFGTFTLEETRELKVELLQREDIEAVRIAKIKMKITETNEEEEWDKFKNNHNLTVLAFLDGSIELFGQYVEGCRQVARAMPGGLVFANGFKTIITYRMARYIASEINRQLQGRARLATFSIKFVD
jgi:hypothetical protein